MAGSAGGVGVKEDYIGGAAKDFLFFNTKSGRKKEEEEKDWK